MMKDVSCPQCNFSFLVNTKTKNTYKNKSHIILKRENAKGWGCPACGHQHYDVYADVCPTCKIDFNSKEFDDICRQKGLIK